MPLQFLHLQKCLTQARPLSRAVVNRTALRHLRLPSLAL